MQVRVKGSGMLLASLVLMTVFRAARGEANKTIQMKTAIFPIMEEATFVSIVDATSKVKEMRIVDQFTCWDTVPGRFDALGLQFFLN